MAERSGLGDFLDESVEPTGSGGAEDAIDATISQVVRQQQELQAQDEYLDAISQTQQEYQQHDVEHVQQQHYQAQASTIEDFHEQQQLQKFGGTESGWDEHIVEEELHGTIVLGNNGRFYVAIDDSDAEGIDEIDLQKFASAFIVDNEDGTETLVLEDTAERDRLIAGKAHAKVEKALKRWEQEGNLHFSQQTQREEFKPQTPQIIGEVALEEVLENDATEVYDEYGIKQRRSRVYGRCQCQECGQTFINMARLERHLAVHQQYGAFLCPLCNKTYKYEYNLFYHWRRTCRDMNDLLSPEERKIIEINALRQLVEEIAQKKMSLGPLELGWTGPKLRDKLSQSQIIPSMMDRTNKLSVENLFGEKVALCNLCNLTVYQKHLPYHQAVHRGQRALDERGVGGAFFCDLCGLMFRSHAVLIKHWRTGCAAIQANLTGDSEFAMDDQALKQLVFDILKRSSREEDSSISNDQYQFYAIESDRQEQPSTSQQRKLRSTRRYNGSSLSLSRKTAADEYDEQHEHETETIPDQLDEQWAQSEGIIFADDYLDLDEEDTLIINDEGKLVSRLDQQRYPMAGPQHFNQYASHGAQAVRGADGELRWIQYPQSVQCNECFRSFSSIQRLEKHVAAAHCSFGTHHCLLCGSRFKYEYNLMFHYRQVCPYTLELLEQEMRQQMEAADLKKAIRQLAADPDLLQQRLHNRNLALTHPASSAFMQQQSPSYSNNLGAIDSATMATSQRQRSSQSQENDAQRMPPPDIKPELGDSVIRRQMMKKIIQKYATKDQQEPNSSQPYLQLPPHLLQPVNRPDLPNGTQCPICAVVFYGLKVLVRHLKIAHPNESTVWEDSLRTLDGNDGGGHKLQPSRVATSRKRRRTEQQQRGGSEERPPQLELEIMQQQPQLGEEGGAVEEETHEEEVDVEGGFTPQHQQQPQQQQAYYESDGTTGTRRRRRTTQSEY